MRSTFPLLFPIFLTLTLTTAIPIHDILNPSISSLGESCSTSAPCPANHYCTSDNTCTPIPYSPVVTPTGPATTGTNVQHLLMLSDVQPYYVRCKEEPKDQCIFHATTLPLEEALEEAMERQAQCVEHLARTLPNVQALFDNGDITNNGSEREVRRIEQYHSTRLAASGLPLVVQMGNHDYRMAAEPDAIRAIAYFETTVRNIGLPLRNIDYDTTPVVVNGAGERWKYSQGSFCYSIEWNNYVFITLHWATAQSQTGLWTPTFEHYDERNDATHHINVTDPTDWLLAEIADAGANGKSVILMPHSFKGLTTYTDGNNAAKQAFFNARHIIAVIAAHDHDAYGRDGNWNIVLNESEGRMVRNIPLYYTGSVSYEKMIAVKLRQRQRGINVTVYDSRFGSACSKTGSSPSGD